MHDAPHKYSEDPDFMPSESRTHRHFVSYWGLSPASSNKGIASGSKACVLRTEVYNIFSLSAVPMFASKLLSRLRLRVNRLRGGWIA